MRNLFLISLFVFIHLGVVSCSSSETDVADEPTTPQTTDEPDNPETTQEPDNLNLQPRRLKTVFFDYMTNDIVNHEISYQYTSAGLVQAETFPSTDDGTSRVFESYTYDEMGILKSSSNIRNESTYLPDGEKIITITRTPKDRDSEIKQYQYDADNKVVRVENGFLDFPAYCQPDSNNLLPGKGNLNFTYEDNGIVSAVSDTGDVSALYTYDAQNKLSSRTTTVDCGNGAITETFSYNAAGLLSTYESIDTLDLPITTYGNNSFDEITYNERGQIKTRKVRLAREPTDWLSIVNYLYDSRNELVEIQLTKKGELVTTTQFTYEDGACEHQTYTDPEYEFSPTHSLRQISFYPQPLNCGYFMQNY